MSVHEVFIYLHVRNAPQAMDFFARSFGAAEKFRLRTVRADGTRRNDAGDLDPDDQ